MLVNNVGGTIWIKPYHLYTEEEVKLELERSLYPTLWCCLAVLPIMMKQQSGSIVNLGSQSTRGLYRLPYAASKGGILALTKVLAMEYGRYGIRINAMAPGGTEISDRVTPRQFIKPGVMVDGGRGGGRIPARDGRGHPQPAGAAPARPAGGAGGGDRVSGLGRRQLHHRPGDQLQRRAVLALGFGWFDVVVGEHAKRGALDIVVLPALQRPQERREPDQPERQRHRHEIDQHVHAGTSLGTNWGRAGICAAPASGPAGH